MKATYGEVDGSMLSSFCPENQEKIPEDCGERQ